MIIKNASILTDKFVFEKKDIRFDEKIREIGNIKETAEDKVLDFEGALVIPGYVDIHTHGAVDVDAMDENPDLKKWREFLLSKGVTTFLPSTVTETEEKIKKICANLSECDGINLEGPFISYEKKGAHDETKITKVNLELLKEIKDIVKITTIAPEMWDNMDKIKKITELGIKVAVGHTTADYDLSVKAFNEGATQLTHTFNAMPSILHRNPGPIGAAFENENVFCEIIADGIHVHPSAIRLMYNALGADRMVLISDSMRATGMPDGDYQLGGLHVIVKSGEATLEDGTIAGSTRTLGEMVENAVRFGIPIEDAVKMATLTPARAVGMDDKIGSLTVGKDADIAVIDKDMKILTVFRKGIN